jgi:hypothetical protein
MTGDETREIDEYERATALVLSRWIKTVGNFRRTRYRGVERTSFAAYLVGAAYNLLRIGKLCPV